MVPNEQSGWSVDLRERRFAAGLLEDQRDDDRLARHERAGGAATDGRQRLLDVPITSLWVS
mgnify:CR=1 FL=1